MQFSTILTLCGLLIAVNAHLKTRDDTQARKVIGGEDARQGEFPYQLSLRYLGEHYCGASLVIVNNRHVVITAASCVDSKTPSQLTVVAGDLDRLDTSGFEQTRQVETIIVHGNYTSWTSGNDIAILEIDSPFNITSSVSPIPLPTHGKETQGQVVVTGWGASNGQFSTILQKVEVPVVSDSQCQDAYYPSTIFPSMICAGPICQGDFGGPARAVNGGYLAGIFSYGYECGDPNFPGVHTEVSHFIDWIQGYVK